MPLINTINISQGKLIIDLLNTPKPHVGKQQILRLLHAPGCRHCVILRKVWDKFIMKNPTLFKYETFDCSENNTLCRDHKVKGVPCVYKVIENSLYDKHIGSTDYKTFHLFATADITLSKKMILPEIVKPELPKPGIPEPVVSPPVVSPPVVSPPVIPEPTVSHMVIEKTKPTSGKKTVVLVYLPHCGFCKRFIPVWDEASDKYKDTFTFVKLNCSDNQCGGYKYEGVPTIFIKDGDTIIDTSVGYKDFDGFKGFLENNIDNQDSGNNIKPIQKLGYEVILGYTAHCPFCVKFLPIWETISDKYNITFTKLNCANNECSGYNTTGVPFIFIKLDDKEIARNIGYIEEALFDAFLTKHITPDKLILNDKPVVENDKPVVENDKPVVENDKHNIVIQSSKDKFDNTFNDKLDSVILVYMPSCGFCKKFLPIWDIAISKFVNKFNFLKLNCTEGECKGYDFRGVPTIFIKDSVKKTIDTSVGFIEYPVFESFLNKNLKSNQPVIDTIDKNIEPSIIKSKITISMMYSPYCGFCKKILPSWDKMVDKHSSNFIFEKNDCTESNKCSINNIEGVPTIIKTRDGVVISKSVGYKDVDKLEQFILE